MSIGAVSYLPDMISWMQKLIRCSALKVHAASVRASAVQMTWNLK